MDFYIFDLDFNFHGILDDYVSIPITRSYEKKTSFTIEVPPTEKNLTLLKPERLIAKKTDLEHAFIIETVDYRDGVNSSLEATVFSLHHLLKRRAIGDQQTFYGSVGQVLSNFVVHNAINPSNPNRIIPNLVNHQNNNIGPTTTESRTSGQLDEVLFNIANKHEITWDILLDIENKQFVFKVWQGVDRSENQNNNARVIFSKEFDNVINQHYLDSYDDFKNVAIVAGEDEGAARKRIIVNDEYSGFERHELFVDARDLKSSYYDENDNEVNLSESEYDELLRERGKSRLAEHQKIQLLDSEVNLESSFKYEEDFFLGDVVSIKNKKLGLIVHTRITQVVENYSKEGKLLKASFGSNTPTLLEKIKKAVK